jgi:4-hydroxythreonine-4-phosphate dehydrogenase
MNLPSGLMNLKINPILKSNKIKVGITMGDPSGIGPAVTLKAISALKGKADFVVIGDRWVFNNAGEDRKQKTEGGCFVDLNNVNHEKFSFGKVKAEYGRASIEYLDKAMELINAGQIDCLVTAPISKEAVKKAGFNYGGHTEYFQKRCGVSEVVMMLLNDKIRFSLITRHIPLRDVSKSLSADKLRGNILITNQALKKLFGISNPRIGLCGLNPHASENGLIGNEEDKVIKPALKKLNTGINISGPLSSDVAVLRASKGKFDCLIAMYHDQALIPLKLTGYDTGVNITLGLPFIRTSPLHGTAFDIAGTSRLASPSSMIAALKLAIKCAFNLKKV